MELVTEVILIFLKLFPAEIEVPTEIILRFQEGFEISRGEPAPDGFSTFPGMKLPGLLV